jgi:ribosomal protein L35AE/L33A
MLNLQVQELRAEQMLNHTVRYQSTRTAGRYFLGKVVCVDGDHCVVRHKTEPYAVVVRKDRLEIMDNHRHRFAGRAG